MQARRMRCAMLRPMGAARIAHGLTHTSGSTFRAMCGSHLGDAPMSLGDTTLMTRLNVPKQQLSCNCLTRRSGGMDCFQGHQAAPMPVITGSHSHRWHLRHPAALKTGHIYTIASAQQCSHPQHRLLSLQWLHQWPLRQLQLMLHLMHRLSLPLMLHLQHPLTHHQSSHPRPLPTISVTTAATHVTLVLVGSATSQDSMEMTTGHVDA